MEYGRRCLKWFGHLMCVYWNEPAFRACNVRSSGCKNGLDQAKGLKLKKISMAEATQLETKRALREEVSLLSLKGIRAT